jgi:hypothetical protein
MEGIDALLAVSCLLYLVFLCWGHLDGLNISLCFLRKNKSSTFEINGK